VVCDASSVETFFQAPLPVERQNEAIIGSTQASRSIGKPGAGQPARGRLATLRATSNPWISQENADAGAWDTQQQPLKPERACCSEPCTLELSKAQISFPARTRWLKVRPFHSACIQMQDSAGRREAPSHSRPSRDEERRRASPRLRWASPKIALLSHHAQIGPVAAMTAATPPGKCFLKQGASTIAVEGQSRRVSSRCRLRSTRSSKDAFRPGRSTTSLLQPVRVS